VNIIVNSVVNYKYIILKKGFLEEKITIEIFYYEYMKIMLVVIK